MKYLSTRGKSRPLSFFQAVNQGLAEDGGLFVPADGNHLSNIKSLHKCNFAKTAEVLLAPFVAEDFEAELEEMTIRAFNFEIPLLDIGRDTGLL